MSTAISLDRVSRTFGQVRALDDLSIDVQPGELLCLLGPSGCGKTTLLRVVAGLERPDHGTVRIGAVDVTGVPARNRPIGMVFQSYALFPNLTVAENVRFPLDVRGVSRTEADERVAELLDLVQLTSQAGRYPHQVSGGQAQRCALARALAPRPEVLLLDEPLSALDVIVRAALRDEIRQVQQSVGTTTVYVTHDQSEALAIADRVAVMNHGRIEQVDRPEEVYRDPTSLFSATFVGGRNRLDLPVHGGRVSLGAAFDVAAPAGANGRAMALIAPEDVVLGGPTDGGQPAIVSSRTFHGATTRLALLAEVDGRQIKLTAEVPSRVATELSNDAEVTVHVAPEHVRLFPV
ncbi:MAG: putative spermidine/putrescine transport system ATP-binding protein [Chloroflexota bacterium]|nr:putative spermidine/putrescine transport system ATP-binding protein [Chloroflexota bacterium]